MFIDERDNNFNYLNDEDNYEFEQELNQTSLYNTDYDSNKYSNYEGTNYIFNYYRPVSNLTDIESGFLRGNMFNDIYDGYFKKIKKITSKNERERLLLKIQGLTFASIDLSLYLDINPNDKDITSKFEKINRELDKNVKEYERIYGPLKSECDKDSNTYEWINGPWPWNELGGNK